MRIPTSPLRWEFVSTVYTYMPYIMYYIIYLRNDSTYRIPLHPQLKTP